MTNITAAPSLAIKNGDSEVLFMPILVMAVVAFIIFLVLMGLVTSAVVSEQKKEKRDRLRSDIAALEATSPKSDEVSRSA